MAVNKCQKNHDKVKMERLPSDDGIIKKKAHCDGLPSDLSRGVGLAPDVREGNNERLALTATSCRDCRFVVVSFRAQLHCGKYQPLWFTVSSRTDNSVQVSIWER